MSGIYDSDESTMSPSEKLAYVMEVRDIFGDEAAEDVADQLGIFFGGLDGDSGREGAAAPASREAQPSLAAPTGTFWT